MPVSTALAAMLPAVGPQPALLPDWLDAEHLISSFGTYALIGIVVVVFIETGLLFPLLPGDSLLFTAGALVAQDALDFPLWLLCALLFLAAFLGDQVAYFIGHKAGPRLFRRPDSRIFKQQYIDQTYAYFDRYGGRTVILARFVPIVRTYAPVAAGVGRMRYRTFVSYNVIGALVWGVGITVLGYALGNITFVRENIEALAVLVVFISVIPVGIELWRGRRAAQRADGGRDERYDEPAERAEVERKAFEQ
jgi:membrane-associated protein